MKFYKMLYFLTIYLPLRVRDLFVNFLVIFFRRDRVIDVACMFLNGRSLIGILPDRNLLVYPLDDFKLLQIISEVYFNKIYDVEQMNSFRNICDIGSHIGIFTLRMSREAKNSNILSIEPNLINFEYLSRNIALNGLSNRAYPLNVAIGRINGKAVLYLNKISRGDSSLKRWHNSGFAGNYSVDMLSLDNVLSKEKIYDLLKIDVEGAENEVLKGLGNQYKIVNRFVLEIHTSIVDITEIYGWLLLHNFMITKKHKLYSDCLLLEAQRICA